MTKTEQDIRAEFSLAEAKQAVSKTKSDADPILERELQDAADFKKQKNDLDLKSIQSNHRDRKANRKMRKAYATWVFRYLVCYSLGVAFFLFASGIQDERFTLDPSVLQILVGSTAVSAIGLVLAVTTGLFNKRD